MSKFKIRYNQSRGKPNRGTEEHVWRVFEDDKEYLCKNVKINVPSYGAKTGEDWSICCEGTMEVCRDTSTITINP
ncbi:hypothetical protein UFOVP447_57 [uncultured Caudovirales phage]|uniref:Uncharacterized protein n=1 Tax=uncultured Caudovirales phage TaxID=2100421 RepID=A0A6J5MGY0_9CAUD|nr:hypothetical protein UFOVP447_57 [uncultured Caudovirales phage]